MSTIFSVGRVRPLFMEEKLCVCVYAVCTYVCRALIEADEILGENQRSNIVTGDDRRIIQSLKFKYLSGEDRQNIKLKM